LESVTYRKRYRMPASDKNHDTSSALKDRAMEGERQAIREMLEECSGNKAEAARRLGIQRSTLYEKMKRLGMD